MTSRRWGPAFSWLDVKLGMRMMRKYPGVSLVIVFALAIGIPLSLLPNHLVGAGTGASPPFDQGERVIGVVGLGQDGRTELRVGDYELLRERLTTLGTLGAAMPVEVNIVSDDGWSEGEQSALMTASLFALTRVPPMMGRTLLPTDEVKGAADVAVVGHGFWRRRLGGARDVVGKTLRIGGVPTTIVGVMPEGFAMPSTQQVWLPLRLRSIDYSDKLGPPVWMYGRLADGATFAQARAEMRTVGLHTVPDVRPNAIRAEAVTFSSVEVAEPRGAVMWLLLSIAQAVPVLLLLIACGNAAILILARTATRWGEVAVRTVLGASRTRIMGQLFVETLLLALIATGIGLIAIDRTVAWLTPRFTLPFWFDPGITPAFAAKALGLSVLCAVVAGVLPALRATGSTLQQTLQSAGAGGAALRLGRIAGALIILEVGLGTAALFAGGMTWRLFQPKPDAHTHAAAADRYLVASIRIPRSEVSARSDANTPAAGPATSSPAAPAARRGDEALRVRLASLQAELGRRLSSQPGVRRWAFSDQPPGEEADQREVRVEGGGSSANERALPGVVTFVDPAFFGVLNVSPVSGRLFAAEDVPLDASVGPTAVIVNMKFLERRGMHPQRAIGARIQLTGAGPAGASEPGPWREIVGVVPNIEPSADRVFFDGTPVIFMPATPGTLHPMTVTIDMGKNPVTFAPKLRSLVAEADPAALLEEVYALDNLPDDTNIIVRIGMSVTIGLSLLAMLLSTTALYALMSMTVAQRRREFGIRLALGGSTRGVMMTVARRALVQIALGVAWGASFWVAVMSWALSGDPGVEVAKSLAPWPYVLAAATTIVSAIALAASLGPTLRYVRMSPIETLRTDG